MSESLVSGKVYHDEDWSHGLSCADCRRLFREGERYSERLDSFMDDTPLATVICLDCALSISQGEAE